MLHYAPELSYRLYRHRKVPDLALCNRAPRFDSFDSYDGVSRTKMRCHWIAFNAIDLHRCNSRKLDCIRCNQVKLNVAWFNCNLMHSGETSCIVVQILRSSVTERCIELQCALHCKPLQHSCTYLHVALLRST
jgi:hypothetical protein